MPISYAITDDGVSVAIVNRHSNVVDVTFLSVFAIDYNGHAFNADVELVPEELQP